MPGFIDSHAHGFWGGEELKKANLNDKAVTVSELIAYAKTQLQRKEAYTGDVLVINGINLSIWSHIDEIREAFNNGEFANLPLALSGMDKHTLWSNSSLLTRAGLNKQFIDGLQAEKNCIMVLPKMENPMALPAKRAYRSYRLLYQKISIPSRRVKT